MRFPSRPLASSGDILLNSICMTEITPKIRHFKAILYLFINIIDKSIILIEWIDEQNNKIYYYILILIFSLISFFSLRSDILNAMGSRQIFKA